MDVSSAVVDEETAGIVLAFDLAGDDEVLLWWRIMRAAHEETGGDVDGLVARVQTVARDASFQERSVEVFVQAVSSGGADVVERLLELEPWMPALYQSLREPAAAEPAHEWAWLTATQHETVSGYWGDQWPEGLDAWLTERWGPGWDSHPDDYKTAWLDDLLAEWWSQAEPEPVATETDQPPVADAVPPAEFASLPQQPQPPEEPVAQLAAERAAALSEALDEIRQMGVSAEELSDEQVAELLDRAVLEQLNAK